jgi:hypothetical protein
MYKHQATCSRKRIHYFQQDIMLSEENIKTAIATVKDTRNLTEVFKD